MRKLNTIILNNKKVQCLLLIVVLSFGFLSFNQAVSQRIFTIGDSTVQDYTAGYAPRKGWGQMLQSFFSSADVQVLNRAVGGTSSKSFYNSFWGNVKKELKAGDFVFIQFGINDRAADTARKASGDVFKGYLKNYVNETRALGGIPVLVSTVRRSAWNADGTAYDAYHENPGLVREVAAELNVPLIDLDAKNKAGMEAATQAYVDRYWYNTYLAGEYPNYPNGNTDPVHFQEMGALQLAKYVVEGVKSLSTHADMKKLIPFIKPQYALTVTANIPNVGQITRTETYPEGVNIHLKALPFAGHTFINWKNSANSSVSTNSIYQFKMGASATSYKAFFDNENQVCTLAVPTISGFNSFCTGSNTVLTSSAATGNQWYLNGNAITTNGAAKTLTVSSAGNYTVKVTSGVCNESSLPMQVSQTSATLWYLDSDGDTYGDASKSVSACTQPVNYVANKTDLCPADANKIAPGICGCGKTEQSCVDCNGTVNGTATLDKCGICVGGTSVYKACTDSIQGEAACTIDGILNENTNAGFSGTGYANTNNALATSIAWVLQSTSKQAVTISFRYANGGTTNRNGKITLNALSGAEVQLAPTGSWSTWETVSINLNLEKGANTLSLEAITVDGLANIDVLYASLGASQGNCTITALETIQSSSISVYPNPSASKVYFSKEMDWKLRTVSGHLLAQAYGGEIDLTHLAQGTYLLELHDGSSTEIKKIVRE